MSVTIQTEPRRRLSHREDDQQRVGDGLFLVRRCCHRHFVLLGTVMCGSFAITGTHHQPGVREDIRTGRGGEAAMLRQRRDSKLFRWRGSAGPTLVACDAGAPRPKRAKTADHRDIVPGIALNWLVGTEDEREHFAGLSASAAITN